MFSTTVSSARSAAKVSARRTTPDWRKSARSSVFERRIRTPCLLILLVASLGVWTVLMRSFRLCQSQVDTCRRIASWIFRTKTCFNKVFPWSLKMREARLFAKFPSNSARNRAAQSAEICGHVSWEPTCRSWSAGKALPLTVVLSDEIQPGSKRTLLVDGSIQAQTPF